MATQIKLRRGTTAEHSTFTGALAEVTVDTTKKTVVVHDGSTAGGFPLALASAVGSAATPTALGTVYGKMTTAGASPYLTALGYNAGVSTTGAGVTAVGQEAAYTNSTGTQNVAMGYQALYSNSTNSFSTAVGYQALKTATGGQNTAFGRMAMQAMTTGNGNTGLGVNALYTSTTSVNSVAVGDNALFSTTTGSYNVAVGQAAMQSNTTGANSTVVGYQAAYSNSTGLALTAVGYMAGYSTNANSNTAIGYRVMRSNSSGTQNVAVGCNASSDGTATLEANTTGAYNTAIGAGALSSNTTASYGAAIGYQAGYASTGASNTFVGGLAGYGGTNNITSGDHNTIIGYGANAASATAAYQIVIGAEVTGQTGTGYVTIGDYSAKVYCYYRGGATWTQTSDATMKNVIGPDTLGLSFIKRLKPVTFTWKDVGDLPKNHPRYDARGGGDSTTVVHGLIAQEVKEALDAEGCTTFAGWDQGPDGIQAISREMFISPLINAIKELKAELDAAKAEIAALKGA